MNTLVTIGSTEINPIEFNGQRVVTLAMVDQVHSRPEGTARKRFNDNKEKLIEGEDYFVRKTDEAKAEFDIIAPNGLVILTETGYLMLVKSFQDDLAWQVQRQLVKGYFRGQSVAQLQAEHYRELAALKEQLIDSLKTQLDQTGTHLQLMSDRAKQAQNISEGMSRMYYEEEAKVQRLLRSRGKVSLREAEDIREKRREGWDIPAIARWSYRSRDMVKRILETW